jgi:hypothetical protein
MTSNGCGGIRCHYTPVELFTGTTIVGDPGFVFRQLELDVDRECSRDKLGHACNANLLVYAVSISMNSSTG